MRQCGRSMLVLTEGERGLLSKVGRMRRRLCPGHASRVDVQLDPEPGVWLQSFHFLDPEDHSLDPVQEWGEEVEDGAIYGITLRRDPVRPTEPDEAHPALGFVQYRTCKVRRVKAATLNKLVTQLLDPACEEPDYTRIFLSTYRAFSSTNTLIELLFQRDDLVSELDNCDCQKSSLLPLVHTWLEEYGEDFWDPPRHRALRLLSAHLVHRPCFRRLAQRTEALLKKFREEENEISGRCLQAEEPDVPGEPRSRDEAHPWGDTQEPTDFGDLPVKDVAEQLTRLDAELFVKVVPFQCLGCVWSQRDKKEKGNLAPTIRATIAQFNAITNRVITSLLCHAPSFASASAGASSSSPPPCPSSSPAQRARLIEKWIAVAQECRQLRNFSSLKAILSALQSNAIYRLRKTWAAVSRDSIATFDNLCETFPDENCELTSREILVEDGSHATEDDPVPKSPKLCPISRQMCSTNGVVPYLGTFLTVLTMLDTALPDTVEGLINFEKRRREFEILSQIRQLQASCSQYSLPHHPLVDDWLKGLRLLPDQESYELSQQLEPPVDPSPSSPSTWSQRLISKKLTSLLMGGEGQGRKTHADQISVSSSGSSSSEMEDLSTPQSPLRFKLQSLSNSCHDMTEAHAPDTATANSEYTTPPSSPPDSQPDLSGDRSPLQSRSASVSLLPVYNRQVADSCIIRVSVECGNNGNVYKSILLTSQDKTPQVIQRALEKHNMEPMTYQDFTLSQVLANQKELRIPDKANVFYAMCTSANYDFILRQKWRSHWKPLGSASSLGSPPGLCHAK